MDGFLHFCQWRLGQFKNFHLELPPGLQLSFDRRHNFFGVAISAGVGNHYQGLFIRFRLDCPIVIQINIMPQVLPQDRTMRRAYHLKLQSFYPFQSTPDILFKMTQDHIIIVFKIRQKVPVNQVIEQSFIRKMTAKGIRTEKDLIFHQITVKSLRPVQ